MDFSANWGSKESNLGNTSKPGAVKPVEFDFFRPEFHTDPYPLYHRLRSEDPVHRSFMGGTWVLTRYADVKAVLRDRRVGTLETPKQIKDKKQYIQEQGKELDTLAYVSSQLLFYMNPPDHTRLRRLASKAFSSIVVERMRPYVQETVNELLGKVRNTGFMDIISDLAGPLPVIVIAKVLGVPHQDEDRLHHWSNVLSRILDLLLSLGEYERMNRVVLEFQAYLRDLIAERVQKPKADVISALIAAREQGDKLSEDELLATCILLFATGEETTVNTIGNGMLALLRHPDQMEKLKREPTLIQSAVEELLRYDSPVQITGRLALETIEIGGQTIRAGEKILTCLGAANRDPTQFPNPDRLDLTRRENHHLAFGDGIHYCLGAGLARVQGQIAINTLVQQLPNLALHTDKLERRKNIALRGLKSLPVTFTP